MSSEAAAAAAPSAPSAGAVLYAFEQLDAPPTVALRDLEAPLAEARAEADGIRAQARAEGHAEGVAAGLEEARAQLAPALAALAVAADGIDALRAEVAETVERDAVELALQLAEKIVAGAPAVDSERVVDIVRGALRRLVDRRRVTVLVNPDDLDAVRAAADGLIAQLGGIEHCDVQAERRIARGGALVRTDEGEIDARVATQLLRARELVELELGA